MAQHINAKLNISQANFGQSPTGMPVDLFTLTNVNGLMTNTIKDYQNE